MENKYEVTDIYLNAYLLSDNFKYIDIKILEETNRKIVIFCYEKTDKLEQAVQDYKNNEFIHMYVKRYLATKRAITKALRNC